VSFTTQQKGILLNLVSDSLTKFKNIPEDSWNDKPQASKWSKKELLGHLIDSASNHLRRLVIGQYAEGVKIVYQQDEWVRYQNYQESGIADVQTLWKLLNNQICNVIENIPEDKLQNTCDTGEGKIELHTLAYFIEDYIVHMKHHLEQIIPSYQCLE